MGGGGKKDQMAAECKKSWGYKAISQKTSKTTSETAQMKTMRLHSCYCLMRKAINSKQKPQCVLSHQDLLKSMCRKDCEKTCLGEKCIWVIFKYSTERTCSQHLERWTWGNCCGGDIWQSSNFKENSERKRQSKYVPEILSGCCGWSGLRRPWLISTAPQGWALGC